MFPDVTGIPGFCVCLVFTGCSFLGIEVTVARGWQLFSTFVDVKYAVVHTYDFVFRPYHISIYKIK